MAKIKYKTSKRPSTTGTSPIYTAAPQHERSMSKKESYEFLAERIGYKPARIRGAFLALAATAKENAKDGLITLLEGIASIRNTCHGGFESPTGPFVKGVNFLTVVGVALNPLKSAISDMGTVNMTEGANPMIDTVFDEVTRQYGEITGTDEFSIAGSDLGPDTEKDDEYVALADKTGAETKCEITYSDLQNVKAKLTTALTAGEYTLCVYTRSGMGEEFGVCKATRKVVVK